MVTSLENVETQNKKATPLDYLYQAAKSMLRPESPQEPRQETEVQGFGMMDMIESDDCFLLYVDCPGMKKEEIDISIQGNKMNIQCKREIPPPEEGYFHYSERTENELKREILIPHGVDLNFTTSEYIDGVLMIKLLKINRKEDSVVKRIPVSCIVYSYQTRS